MRLLIQQFTVKTYVVQWVYHITNKKDDNTHLHIADTCMTTDFQPNVELWLFQRTYFPINVNDKFSHMIISIRITGISHVIVSIRITGISHVIVSIRITGISQLYMYDYWLQT